MNASLGRFHVTDVDWVGLTAIAATIATDFTDRYWQLYAGRRLIGVSSSAGLSRVVGQLVPAHCPHSLMVVMVEAADRLTDFGRQLPRRPLNQFDILWEAAAYPADAKWFEIAAAIAADTDPDPENVVARSAYLGDGAYQFLLPPVDAPGVWAYRLTPRDDAEPQGNAGPWVDASRYVLPYPPDVANADDGTRLTASVAGGVLKLGFAFDWERGTP